ncbi:integrase family protein [Marinobacter sp. tcs-11]|uniref:tyrosine-type recombinase/integrase n=1 Tax=Marinobacter sp. tcs-11 TaxID=1742860 RepID=UPI00257CFC25|nr:integrase family protein [Marinobacter sp. tcs-11]MEC9040440.1 integrase family protein [Pseudomonadota bacterium]|tara:strand:+ start:1672 stop:2964 length:1293 start_codon:yes stop_codon:yes gene_type:complete
MRVNLTAGRVDGFTPGSDGKQAFLWDSTVPGLAVRATAKTKAFIYQGRIDGKALRVTIGDVKTWGIDDARAEARRLGTLVDQGIDPRLEKKQRLADVREAQNEAKRADVTVGDAWSEYIKARTPRWGEHHRKDHLKISRPGGEPFKRGKGKTQPGVLTPLLSVKLSDIDSDTVGQWLQKEAKDRPTQARLAFALLRAFLHWCNDQPRFQGLASPDACSNRLAKQTLPRKGVKVDCLQREQLQAWFSAVQQIHNPVISAYLQILLLTGARRGELSTLQWSDVDTRWGSLAIHDKVEGERVIPLTPYVAFLIESLPRRNEWVFSSPTAKSGQLIEPRIQHNKALKVAGIEGLTLHGLRRSFGTLSEWVEVPAGIVAQIQGHKPSATVEKHYRQRPLDLLKQWHTKIESWVLEQAGIKFEPPVAGQRLRAVKQ